MRIFIIVDNDRFFIPDMLYRFISKCKEDLVGIGIVKKKYSTWSKYIINMWKEFKKKLVIFGLAGLFKLFFKLILRDIKYYLQGKVNSTKKIAEKFNIKCHKLFDINSPESLLLLKQCNIDLIISIQDQIFGKELIHLPKLGCINKHAALLPKYCGVWPIFWAMLNNEKEVGITIHWIDKGIDTGKIILQKRIPVREDDTLFSLYKRVFGLCSEVLLNAINEINKNPECGIQQFVSDGKYFSFPQRKDMERLKKIGKKVL